MFDRRGAHFTEPRHLGLRPRLIGELVIRPTAPQRECFVEQLAGALEVGELGSRSRGVDEILEPRGVEFVALEAQSVAAGRRLDTVAGIAQSAAKPVQICTYVVIGPLGRLTPGPRDVDQLIDRHDPVGVDHQRSQRSTLRRTPEHHIAWVDHLDRTQHTYLHHTTPRSLIPTLNGPHLAD